MSLFLRSRTLLTQAAAPSGAVEIFVGDAFTDSDNTGQTVTHAGAKVKQTLDNRDVLVQFSYKGGATVVVTGITVNGVACTLRQQSSGGTAGHDIWNVRLTGAVGATADVVITYTGTAPTEVIVTTTIVEGAASITPFDEQYTSGTNSGDTITTVSVEDNGAIWGGMHSLSGSVNDEHAWTVGLTELTQQYSVLSTLGCRASNASADFVSAATPTITYTLEGSLWHRSWIASWSPA